MSLSRIPIKTLYSRVREHWVAHTEQEILDQFETEKINYPEQGYGTMLTDLRADPTGLLYHAEFTRYGSCD